MREDSLPRSRSRLAAVLRATKDVISVSVASATLGTDRRRAAQVLARWSKQGWLRRVGHGLYVHVPIELASNEQVVADPWVLLPPLFGQCYVGGWTAAHYWELTEQLFNETVVFTTRRVLKERVTAQGVVFLPHHVHIKRLFGIKTIWRGSTKVSVSDAARTLIDMLAEPRIGGGIDHVTECIAAYLAGKGADHNLLIRYAAQFGNGAIFKRLGFLADTQFGDKTLTAACRDHLTQGYAQLDPALTSSKLVTPWRLWVPVRWKTPTR
jgi:predicted transcriptional regulator of viral defense system